MSTKVQNGDALTEILLDPPVPFGYRSITFNYTQVWNSQTINLKGFVKANQS